MLVTRWVREVETTQSHWNPLLLLITCRSIFVVSSPLYSQWKYSAISNSSCCFCHCIVLETSVYCPEFRDIPESIPTNLLWWLARLLNSTRSKTSNKCVWRPVFYPANSHKFGIVPEYVYVYICCVCVSSCWKYQIRLMFQRHVLFIFWSLFDHFALCFISQRARPKIIPICLLPWPKPG